ncbi:MAG: mitochondrial fission ELM1 family protein [Thiohalobacterales bacterium]|nr:mitochondrial fission ELM1 family protein [Thiohalobacterales bacterium]
MVVWRFTDGKAGHENQTAGLLQALGERTPVVTHDVPADACRSPFFAFLGRRMPCVADLPAPDLIVGAGHATHLPMLAARRARGGHAVVLMKPSLPCTWFDACIIPEHDKPGQRDHVLATRGVLNRIGHPGGKAADAGLILIGGPSSHVTWSDESVAHQVERIVQDTPGIHWQLGTSRRTPSGFTGLLAHLPADRLAIVPFEQAAPDWLPRQLERAVQVWVSEDSVSMVYEALTAGAAVGLLSVKWRKCNDRLGRGIRALQQEGLVTAFDDWRRGTRLKIPAAPFDEAGRCADWLLARWPPGA